MARDQGLVLDARPDEVVGLRSGLRRLARAGRHFAARRPVATGCVAVLLLLALLAAVAPLIAPYDPTDPSAGPALATPSAAHPFGTDNLGRDVFSRTLWGARTSLVVGVLSVAFALVFGCAAGIAAAYWGGLTDQVLMRLADVVLSLPALVLALVVVAVLGPSVLNVVWAIAISYWPVVARVVRADALSINGRAYVEAARATGASHRRIVLRHILPNVLPVLLVYAATVLGGAILAEGGLSFLGVGTPPPLPSWGQDLSGAGRTLMLTAPWLVLFPAAALSLTVLAVNLLADGLRDHLDPRLRAGR